MSKQLQLLMAGSLLGAFLWGMSVNVEGDMHRPKHIPQSCTDTPCCIVCHLREGVILPGVDK